MAVVESGLNNVDECKSQFLGVELIERQLIQGLLVDFDRLLFDLHALVTNQCKRIHVTIHSLDFLRLTPYIDQPELFLRRDGHLHHCLLQGEFDELFSPL
jgi:hypothetical protein